MTLDTLILLVLQAEVMLVLILQVYLQAKQIRELKKNE